ncbi:hypothetical protein AB0A63_19470 [Lentzea sp. NPDC042327]|uniref:hypothetical protein n=1 Tax=Lentzea sp. NPDC042327 TaxID=3154801 RepID=UPI0033ECD518
MVPHLITALAVASAAALAVPLPATAAAAECPPAPESCVDTELALDRLPAVGESATATLHLRPKARVDRAQLVVRLPAGLRLTDRGGLSAPRTAGFGTVAEQSIGLTAERTVRFGVTAVQAGPAQVEATVRTDARLRPARSAATLTVAGQPGASRAGADGADMATVSRTAVQDAQAAANQVCAKGSYSHATPDNTWKPVRNAGVRVEGRITAGSQVTTYGTGLTSAQDGSYRVCFPATTTLSQVWVRFTADSGLWQVRPFTTSTPYTSYTAARTSVATGTEVDFGATAPADFQMRGWRAFDTITRLWGVHGQSRCWTGAETGTCRKLSLWWHPDSTVGAHWDNSVALPDRHVELAAADPDSEHLVIHEAGHGLMDVLHQGWWPRDDCPSPHYPNRVSGTNCGWTEGFANALAGYVMGDGKYVYVNGVEVDLMNTRWFDPSQPTSATNLQNGDQVEARVAGALIRLWREVDNGPVRTFDSLAGNRTSNLREWFLSRRPAAGLDVSASTRNLVYRHTIDYRSA